MTAFLNCVFSFNLLCPFVCPLVHFICSTTLMTLILFSSVHFPFCLNLSNLLFFLFSVSLLASLVSSSVLLLAINLLKDREPGAFIIRDSHSFRGAYGLAMKVACPPPTVQQNKKGKETNFGRLKV